MKLSLQKMIDMPPVWLLGFAVLVWMLGQVLPAPTGLAGVRLIGTALVTAGIGIVLVAAVQFRQHKTTIVPHMTASRMISSGVFGFSRNPIYLADAIILAGLCLRWDILHGLILVPVFVRVIQSRFILGEEERLRAAFGAEFDAYAQKTRRWL